MLLPQCMLLRIWEGKNHVLILVWQYFMLSSFLQFCYWFHLNPWDNTGASTKNISETRRLHSVTFLESSLVHQSCLKLRHRLNPGVLFLQMIDKAPNPCNVLYLTEVKDAFWPIYISVADFHFQPEEWPVVLGWIPVLFWRSWLTCMGTYKMKKLGVRKYFSRELPLQHSGHCCCHSSWRRDLAWTEWGGKGWGGFNGNFF